MDYKELLSSIRGEMVKQAQSEERNKIIRSNRLGPTNSRLAQAAFPEPGNPSGAYYLDSAIRYKTSPKERGRALKLHDAYVARAIGPTPRSNADAFKWKAYSQMSDAELEKTEEALNEYRARAREIKKKNFNAKIDKWHAESRLKAIIRRMQSPDLYPAYGPGDGRWHSDREMTPAQNFKAFTEYRKARKAMGLSY